MKIKKPHCNFCQKDLPMFRVDGASVGEDELVDINFDVVLNTGNTSVSARATSLHKEAFEQTSNPIRHLAVVENWVEELAEEVRCPFCTKNVKLVRILPAQPPPTGPQPVNQPNMQSLLQMLQNAQGHPPQPSGPFQTPRSLLFGQKQAVVRNIFENNLDEQDLIEILSDLDLYNNPMVNPTISDLVSILMDYLYNK